MVQSEWVIKIWPDKHVSTAKPENCGQEDGAVNTFDTDKGLAGPFTISFLGYLTDSPISMISSSAKGPLII